MGDLRRFYVRPANQGPPPAAGHPAMARKGLSGEICVHGRAIRRAKDA
jgi:hypothetical protein